MPDIKPLPGPGTSEQVDQTRLIVESERELPNEETFDARQGGKVMTVEHDESETRPQEMHGAVHYQEVTASMGKPRFVTYTELTSPTETIRG